MSKVYVFLAEGFEEIEGLTVVDILRRAGVDTQMVSISEDKMVTGSHQIPVQADLCIQDADFDQAELLVLPGGSDLCGSERAWRPWTVKRKKGSLLSGI